MDIRALNKNENKEPGHSFSIIESKKTKAVLEEVMKYIFLIILKLIRMDMYTNIFLLQNRKSADT